MYTDVAHKIYARELLFADCLLSCASHFFLLPSANWWSLKHERGSLSPWRSEAQS